eukprot:g9056.t1 g9056   contig34:750274-752022(-)
MKAQTRERLRRSRSNELQISLKSLPEEAEGVAAVRNDDGYDGGHNNIDNDSDVDCNDVDDGDAQITIASILDALPSYSNSEVTTTIQTNLASSKQEQHPPASAQTRPSWKMTDWNASSSLTMGGSQSSLYHVLDFDDLEEQHDGDEEEGENDDDLMLMSSMQKESNNTSSGISSINGGSKQDTSNHNYEEGAGKQSALRKLKQPSFKTSFKRSLHFTLQKEDCSSVFGSSSGGMSGGLRFGARSSALLGESILDDSIDDRSYNGNLVEGSSGADALEKSILDDGAEEDGLFDATTDGDETESRSGSKEKMGNVPTKSFNGENGNKPIVIPIATAYEDEEIMLQQRLEEQQPTIQQQPPEQKQRLQTKLLKQKSRKQDHPSCNEAHPLPHQKQPPQQHADDQRRESWKNIDWEEIDNYGISDYTNSTRRSNTHGGSGLKQSTASSISASQTSVYHLLDLDDDEGVGLDFDGLDIGGKDVGEATSATTLDPKTNNRRPNYSKSSAGGGYRRSVQDTLMKHELHSTFRASPSFMAALASDVDDALDLDSGAIATTEGAFENTTSRTNNNLEGRGTECVEGQVDGS